jgi:hypothetical protein
LKVVTGTGVIVLDGLRQMSVGYVGGGERVNEVLVAEGAGREGGKGKVRNGLDKAGGIFSYIVRDRKSSR